MNGGAGQMALAHAALQGMRQPLLVIDGHCRARLHNPAALEFLARGDVLALRDHDRVVCVDHESARRFAMALDDVLQRRARCRGLRLGDTALTGDVSATLRALELNAVAEPLAVLSLFPSEVCAEACASVLASTFGLTPAEARIATYIARGVATKEIARALGVAVTTVRSHTQGLFEKTGARRQPDLVRRLLLASTL